MRRLFPLIAGIAVLLSSLPAQDLLVNTRLHPTETLDPGETLRLGLADFFQKYNSPGPVATFTIPMPVPDGHRELFFGIQTDSETGDWLYDDEGYPLLDFSETSPTDEIQTFQLQSGESYQHALGIRDAAAFVWEEYSVPFQLLADEAPVTVANFLTYVRDGAYNNTIIHRNEATGEVFQVGNGLMEFNALPIVQAGGWRLYNSDDFLLDTIQTNPPIVLERTRNNTAGTLGMARTNFPDSATSQFFFNLQDNTSAFSDNYAVFGELTNPDEDLPVLNQFADVPVHDLTNIFQGLPFSSVSLYTPYFRDKDSYARIASISVPEGNPEGISYDWTFADTEDDAEPTAEQLANREVFSISMADGQLIVDRSDTGQTTIEVTGSTSDGQSASFTVELTAFSEEALRRFPGATIQQGGRLESPWYGTMEADADFPFIRHDNHGWQYLADSGNIATVYLYDFGLRKWLYTSQILYPDFYDVKDGEWIRYQLGTGDGDTEPRWFYNFNAREWQSFD